MTFAHVNLNDQTVLCHADNKKVVVVHAGAATNKEKRIRKTSIMFGIITGASVPKSSPRPVKISFLSS